MAKSPTLNKRLMSDAAISAGLSKAREALHKERAKIKNLKLEMGIKGKLLPKEYKAIKAYLSIGRFENGASTVKTEDVLREVISSSRFKHPDKFISFLVDLRRSLHEYQHWNAERIRREEWEKQNPNAKKSKRVDGRKMGVW